MAAVTIHRDFGAQDNKVCHYFHFFPFYLPWSDGTWCHDLSFFERWVLSQLFSSSLLSAIKVVLSAYLRLLIFSLAILIPACASSGLAVCIMYSACNLNKQGDNIQLWCTPFTIWNQSVVPCPVLFFFTCIQHIYALIYDCCFSLFDLFHSVWQTLCVYPRLYKLPNLFLYMTE